MKTFHAGGAEYSSENPLCIAELGTSFGTDLDTARALVDAASAAGADCVKIQIVIADEILHPTSGLVPLPGGSVPLFETFRRLEAPLDFYAAVKKYVESKGCLFLATPFGSESAAILEKLEPDLVKIASPELNYTELLETVSSWNIPTLLSSGVSTLADIETALSYFNPAAVCLLHCVTAYPAPETDYNLRLLGALEALFGVPVGVSDHSLDATLVPTLAVAQGACVVEKHFCLSRSGDGLDDPIALPPADFALLTQNVRRVARILGDGVKRLAASEADNYLRTNRSVHALTKIEAGETFTRSNIRCLRTEKILRPGLPPAAYAALLGRRARAPIPAGEGIRAEDVL